ncbi:MAG: DNA adenine methylase [Acidobacteriota bacterium]|nr:DNA adenine methylase [Acidobacteriota bacterium]
MTSTSEASPMLAAPFPYFGGKKNAAPIVWKRFGNPAAYIEPFCGSAAVLLARPSVPTVETINDMDGLVTNFWRAAKCAPDDVADVAAQPVNELDLHARSAYVLEWREKYVEVLRAEPEYYDATVAGYWVYALNHSIGAAVVNGSGSWARRKREDGHHVLARKTDPNQPGTIKNIPKLAHGPKQITRPDYARTRMRRIQQRLAGVRVACGDWGRVVKPSILTARSGGDGTTAVFLDPPYTTGADIYNAQDTRAAAISHEVREWCKTAPPELRICLAGYDTDHDELLAYGWTKVTGRAGGEGYGGVALDSRERLWFSPACLEENTLF